MSLFKPKRDNASLKICLFKLMKVGYTLIKIEKLLHIFNYLLLIDKNMQKIIEVAIFSYNFLEAIYPYKHSLLMSL